jgi:hypothetical protein
MPHRHQTGRPPAAPQRHRRHLAAFVALDARGTGRMDGFPSRSALTASGARRAASPDPIAADAGLAGVGRNGQDRNKIRFEVIMAPRSGAGLQSAKADDGVRTGDPQLGNPAQHRRAGALPGEGAEKRPLRPAPTRSGQVVTGPKLAPRCRARVHSTAAAGRRFRALAYGSATSCWAISRMLATGRCTTSATSIRRSPTQ